MGGSAKAEERLFCSTNYFNELTNFYPKLKFQFYFVGPELSTERHGKTHKINDNMEALFYRATTGELLLKHFGSLNNVRE